MAVVFERYADVVTVKELCEMLKVGRNTAYDLIHSGAIPGVMVGRQIRVRKESVICFLEAHIPLKDVELSRH